jgi:hypothetical protein
MEGATMKPSNPPPVDTAMARTDPGTDPPDRPMERAPELTVTIPRPERRGLSRTGSLRHPNGLSLARVTGALSAVVRRL